jgi:hypothetical protein
MTIRRLGLFAVSLLLCTLGPVLASDEPDELAPGRIVIIKPGTLAKFVSKPTSGSFDLPDATNDPRTEGGTLQIFDTGAAGGDNTYTLPTTGWTGLGNPAGSKGYKYKGAGSPTDPCRVVIVKSAVVKAVCKGSAVTLTVPFAGNVGIVLTVGTDSKRYCASFGGTSVGSSTLIKRKSAPAPGSCPAAPVATTTTSTIGSSTTTTSSTTIPGPSALCPADPSRILFAGGPNSGACHTYDNDQVNCEQAYHMTGGDCGGAASCYFDFFSGDCNGCGPNNESAGSCINTCLAGPNPTCPGDPTRTVFAGFSGSQACQALSINPTLCNKAFHIGQDGIVASCYFDVDADECLGCGRNNFESGACQNTCPVCPGNPARTDFAGFPGGAGCHKYDASPSSCAGAFIDSDGTLKPTSCYYDSDLSECRGCGPNNQSDGACVNECATCDNDPSRTIFLGGPNSSPCHTFDSNPILCNQAYHLGGQCLQYASCFYSVDNGDCEGCGPTNQAEGLCSNTCAAPICGDNDVNLPLEQCDGGDDGACLAGEFCNFNCSCQGCPNDGTIAPAGGVIASTTSGGGPGNLGGLCADSTESPEKVYQWTPSNSGTATIKLCAQFFYGVVYLRSGGCTGSEVGCGAFQFPAQGGCFSSALITPTVSAGTPYSVIVDGYAGASGSFTLTVTGASPSGAFLDDSEGSL